MLSTILSPLKKNIYYPIKFLRYSRSTENDIFPLTFMVESAH